MDGVSLGTWGIGIVIAAVGKILMNAWNSHKQAIADSLKAQADKTEAFIADKFNVQTSKSMHDRIDGWIDNGISTADSLAGNGAFWRNLLRTAVDKNPARMEIYYADFLKIDPKKYIMDQLSDELKTLVNGEKNTIATSIVKASIAKHAEIVEIAKGNLEAVTTAVAEAAKADKSQKVILHSEEPLTEDLMKKLVEESRARQLALQGK